jgi:hypothetical protein
MCCKTTEDNAMPFLKIFSAPSASRR